MSSTNGPRPGLSVENTELLRRALVLSNDLQSAASDRDTRLLELKTLLDKCRAGIRNQNPDHTRYRLKAVNRARHYLHFLPDMEDPDAVGRLRSVSKRLEQALRTA